MFKILLADDEEDVLAVYSARLSSWGYEVIIARDGKEVLDLAIKSLPDLCLIDRKMPVIDGFEVCRTLKENVKTRHIPLIMITASPHSLLEEERKTFGLDEIMSKPLVMKTLQEKIRHYLGDKA